MTGRVIGTGVRHNGLWFMNQEQLALGVATGTQKREIYCFIANYPFTIITNYPFTFTIIIPHIHTMILTKFRHIH